MRKLVAVAVLALGTPLWIVYCIPAEGSASQRTELRSNEELEATGEVEPAIAALKRQVSPRGSSSCRKGTGGIFKRRSLLRLTDCHRAPPSILS